MCLCTHFLRVHNVNGIWIHGNTYRGATTRVNIFKLNQTHHMWWCWCCCASRCYGAFGGKPRTPREPHKLVDCTSHKSPPNSRTHTVWTMIIHMCVYGGCTLDATSPSLVRRADAATSVAAVWLPQHMQIHIRCVCVCASAVFTTMRNEITCIYGYSFYTSSSWDGRVFITNWGNLFTDAECFTLNSN